jgi:hypothetical protein
MRTKLEIEVELEAMRRESLNIAEWNDRLIGETAAFIAALEWVLQPSITEPDAMQEDKLARLCQELITQRNNRRKK